MAGNFGGDPDDMITDINVVPLVDIILVVLIIFMLTANLIAKQAEAERERRAVIIKADGELQASTNLITAAGILGKADGAMHLRTLQSLNDMSSDQTNTIRFVLPIEIMKA